MQKLVEGIHQFQNGIFSAKKRLIERLVNGTNGQPPRLMATVEENVLVQLEHVQTYPSVAAALATKTLNLHGWVYEFETGQVFDYHPQDGQFVVRDGGRPQ